MKKRGLLAILPGKKELSPVGNSEGYTYYDALKKHVLGTSFSPQVSYLPYLALDIETGGREECASSSGIGIRADELALHHETNEILLAGTFSHEFRYLPFEGSERQLLEQVIELIDQAHRNGSILLGHNAIGFDLRIVIHRAIARGVSVPRWLVLATRKTERFKRSAEVLDTLRLFDSRLFSQKDTSVSLNHLSFFWGRSLPSEGSTFGEQWRSGGETVKRRLWNYNAWNLLDTVNLAVLSGALDSFRSEEVSLFEGELPRGAAWRSGSSCPPRPAPSFTGKVSKAGTDSAVVSWLTAPLPDLYPDGPYGTWQSVRIKKEEARLAWPFEGGKQHAGSVQIVGMVCASDSGVDYIWRPDDEVAAISEALAVLDARRLECQCHTVDRRSFRCLLTLRASLYNMVLAPWVNGFGTGEWLHDVTMLGCAYDSTDPIEEIQRFGVINGFLKSFDENPLLPLYCGQNVTAFYDQAVASAHLLLAYISSNPWSQCLPSSPLARNPEPYDIAFRRHAVY